MYYVLLIVPYGIETLLHLRHYFVPSFLLIVPYGIETVMADNMQSDLWLLIVPYGIETSFCLWCLIVFFAFNRTLWN